MTSGGMPGIAALCALCAFACVCYMGVCCQEGWPEGGVEGFKNRRRRSPAPKARAQAPKACGKDSEERGEGTAALRRAPAGRRTAS